MDTTPVEEINLPLEIRMVDLVGRCVGGAQDHERTLHRFCLGREGDRASTSGQSSCTEGSKPLPAREKGALGAHGCLQNEMASRNEGVGVAGLCGESIPDRPSV